MRLHMPIHPLKAFGTVACLSLVLSGCGSSDDADVDKQPEPKPKPEPATVVALYDASAKSELHPYPSNRYTREDTSSPTGLRVDITDKNTADEYALASQAALDQLNELDGFSPVGGISLKFSGSFKIEGLGIDEYDDPPVTGPILDAAEFTNEGSQFYLVNVDPDSKDQGELVGLVPWVFRQKKDDFWLFDEYTAILQPAVPLDGGTTYAFIATRKLTAYDGTPVGASEDMLALLNDPPETDYAEQVQDALPTVEAATGVEVDDIALATVFTVGNVHTELDALASARREAAAPDMSTAWSVETPQVTDGDRRVRFVGSYVSPEYRRPAPNGKFEFDDQGVAKPQKDVDLEAFLAFSDGDKSGPRPVVIYGHGLGGDKDGCWGTSERLGPVHENGVAVFAIDSPEHGSRLDGETTLLTSVYSFFGVDEPTGSFDVGRARDNFRQMAADQFELVRLIKSLGDLDLLPVGAPDGVPDLDVSKIFYIGHSFGAVQGATIAAIAPEITHAVWNVGGGSLMTLLRDSNTFRYVVEGLAPEGTPFGGTARFMSVLQGIVDPGDPVNYARYATIEGLPGVSNWKPRSVLLQEVVKDGIVPNSSTEALARAAGMQQLGKITPISGVESLTGSTTANLASGSTAVVSQYDKDDEGKTVDHGSLIFQQVAQDQYVEFFKSGLDGKAATVTEPYK